MAERRMFAKTLIDSDAFLDMPMSTQCLYFHMAMRADDDGFLNNPKKVQRMVGATDDDMKILFAKSYLIAFESGVVVIKHWRIHNYIQKDRYKPTIYQKEKALLSLEDNGSYTECIQDGYTGKDRLVKGSVGKDRLIEGSKEPLSDSPTGKSNAIVAEVIDYLNEKAGTAYRANTKANATLILARHKEGATLEDFKSVIDRKCAEWLHDDRMSQYLRPKTLFAAQNFDSYLGAKNAPVKRVGANGVEYEVNADREDEFDGIF